MKLFYIITILFLFAGTIVKAQQTEIQVVYNNTADINSGTDIINNIKSSVKTEELKLALISNGHISDKNLIIRIAFLDRGLIGQLKLKSEHELSPEKYIEKWQEMVKSRSGVLFLFVKRKKESEYTFFNMVPSTQLKDEHLLPLVTGFINTHLHQDYTTNVSLSEKYTAIVNNGTRFIANALTPVWDVDKEDTRSIKSLAEDLINNNPKYWANKINIDYDFSYFDLRPSSSEETKNMKLVNCMTKKTGGDWFMSDKYIYTTIEELGGSKSISCYEWDIEIDEDVSGCIILYDAFLYKILNYIDETKKHNPTQNASDWPWKVTKGVREITNFDNFSDRKTTDRVVLFKSQDYKNREGQEISVLSPTYDNITWCNVYARDLACSYLFPGIVSKSDPPWGYTKGRASHIHEKILTHPDFVSATFDEAWEYTNKGYIVYLTAYNHEYYKNPEKGAKHPGHIATCYPTPDYVPGNYKTGKVIQGGSSWGILNFGVNVWTDKNYGTNKEGVVFPHIYLGYILKK